MIATARERIAKLREAEKWWARVVEPRGSLAGGSASKEQQRNTFKEAADAVSVGFATWLLLWNDSASGKGDASGDLCAWIGNLERLEEMRGLSSAQLGATPSGTSYR